MRFASFVSKSFVSAAMSPVGVCPSSLRITDSSCFLSFVLQSELEKGNHRDLIGHKGLSKFQIEYCRQTVVLVHLVGLKFPCNRGGTYVRGSMAASMMQAEQTPNTD